MQADGNAASGAKPPKRGATVRGSAAAVFLLAVLATVPTAMLAWGRLGAAQPAGAGPAAVIPPEGALWPVQLSREDGDRLMEVFFAALAEGGESQGAEPAFGPGLAESADAPVFVTVFAPGAPAVRACGRKGTLAGGVRDAAAQVRERAAAGLNADELRVRIDVLQEALPFPEQQRMAFAQVQIGEPAGVALQSGGRQFWFLPADIVDYQAATNDAVLLLLCRQAGLEPMRWRSPGLRMWRLRTVGFVNSEPGSRYCLESPRGLVPLREPGVARLLRACRLGAGYLLRVQQTDGTFVTYRDAATGLRGGCGSAAEQAVAAGALAMQGELRPNAEYPPACYRCLSSAMASTDTDAANPRMAFTRRQEVCNIAFELETSAQVLEALCRYRRTSGLAEPDAWIASLAEFLLFMQRDDGLFELAYDGRSGERSNPGPNADSPVPQAKAATALLLAHRELAVPKYLAAAQRALAALRVRQAARETPCEAREARWLAAALREAAPLLPGQGCVEWLGRLAAARRKAQLLAGDVPADDLVGATLGRFPPAAQATADDLVVFASACMIDAPDRAENLAAARRAAAWLMHVQYLPENSYYLPDPDAAAGGLREQIGGNVIRVQTLESALRGLTMLARLELQDIRRHDREG